MKASDVPPGKLAQGLFKLGFDAMGTRCEVAFRCESVPVAENYRSAVLSWVKAFEAKYSRFREDSLISHINRQSGEGWVAIDEGTEHLLGLADSVVFLSSGVLDPTSLPLTRLWKRAERQGRRPRQEEVESTLKLVGWNKVERCPGKIRLPVQGMALDLGGYGKEYAVDAVAALAERQGIRDVMVDFGRDIRAMGIPPDAPCWVIGVEDAEAPGQVWERIGVSDRGVASSGNYRRFFEVGGERFGHIIDPRTGWPVHTDCEAATVIAPTCLEAGVLATTCTIVGPEEGLKMINRSVTAEGCLQTSTRKMESRQYHRYHLPNSSEV